MPVPALSSRLIYSAQYLRFIAASMVVLVHAYELIPPHGIGDIGHSFNLGAAGVDIFFVISGFIMCMITQTREKGAGDFLLHRLLRVAPPYWAITALMTLLVVFAPQLFDSSRIVIPHVLTSFLFLPWPHPVLGDALPIYFPGWTLNYEALFYVIFALFLRFGLKVRIISVGAILLGLAITGLVLPGESEVCRFYTRPIMIEFMFGMLIAACYLSGKVPEKPICWGMIVLSVALFVVGAVYWPVARLATERFLVWGIPAALLVAGSIFLESHHGVRRNEFFRLLGDASYAAYLTHFFVIGAIGVAWSKLHLERLGSDVYMILTCFLLSWISGIVYHLLFEKPVVNWLRRRFLPRPATTGPIP